MVSARKRWLDTENVKQFSSLHAMSEHWPTGSSYLSVSSHKHEALDFYWDYRGSDRTIVLFHAALNSSVTTLPVFLGQNLTSDLDMNCLYIADPAHYCSDKILTGWYMGTRQVPDFQPQLVLLLERIRKEYGQQQFIFFGASAGGFASLFFSSYFPNSVAVAVNPQSNIEGHSAKAIADLCRYAWLIDYHVYAPLRKLPTVHNIIPYYSRPFSNRVLYIQNLQDEIHMREQYRPFVDAVNKTGDAVAVLGKWGKGHLPPPRDFLRKILETLSSADDVTEVAEYAIATARDEVLTRNLGSQQQ